MPLKFILTILMLPLTSPHVLGQQYHLIKSISIDTPVDVASDPLGHIYLQTIRGDVVKLNLNGEELQRNNLSNTENITSIQTGQSLRLFTFYRESQQFQYFDRLLNPSSLFTLPDLDNSFFRQAAPSSDNGLWLWDASNLALKKYKPALQDVTLTTHAQYYLQKGHDISQLQEYQNRVYLNDCKHEIMVFDALGNYIQKLPVAKVARFSFYYDELYWVENNTLYLYHLYNMRKRQMELPPSGKALFVVLAEDRLLIFENSELFIYRILHH